MGIFSWIFLGLIAGALAKFIMPGKDQDGILVTILIGIAGAIVGGFLGSFIGLGKVESSGSSLPPTERDLLNSHQLSLG
jgi:uncharacterized membrane protein YeaQ/YmgE (transglycosylase-associated protein family)